ncbi:CNNM domain-containing protein [Polymorphobacter sp.]|uniref:CNNM domain-containing protein n=1 Tax=Polymorphobacter sp. TaxID=1909290 RepID=UPI003F6E8A72
MVEILLLFFAVSIVASFFCSLWEAVLLSISPAYMQQQLTSGSGLGRALADFKTNIDRPLAAILSLNTIAHTAGAIGVGQQATLIWGDSDPLITGLVVPVAMTLAILLFSEIVPKTLGANNWRSLAPMTVRSLNVLIRLLKPLIWLCQLVTRIVSRGDKEDSFNRADLVAMTEIGEEEGELDDREGEFIRNLMGFREVRVRAIMTPRTVVTSAPGDLSFRQFYDRHEELTFSRIPIRGADSAELLGYVLKDEVLEQIVDGDDKEPLESIMRPIITVPDQESLFALFDRLMKEHEHIASVVDSYGSMVGIVTMEDIVETLLGAEIMDETDRIADMQSHARRHWQQRSRAMGLAPGQSPPGQEIEPQR